VRTAFFCTAPRADDLSRSLAAGRLSFAAALFFVALCAFGLVPVAGQSLVDARLQLSSSARRAPGLKRSWAFFWRSLLLPHLPHYVPARRSCTFAAHRADDLTRSLAAGRPA
jgi:hypothetical protein